MPDKKKLDEYIDLAVMPGADGDFEVQEGHAPFITMLRPGTMRTQKNGKSEYYAIHEGFVSVENNNIMILSEICEEKSEIVLNRAVLAKERAEERMKSKTSDSDIEFRRAENALKKALTRISTANN